MDPGRQLSDIQAFSQLMKRQQIITWGVGALALMLAAISMTKQSTTILEPPTRSKTIAVTGDRYDAAGLEEMGEWVAHMMLDASPHSIVWQQEKILRWTHPATHGQLQQDMAVQAKRLTDRNASTVFWMQQVAPDVDRQRVAVVGELQTFVNGLRVDGSTRTVSYVAQFESKGGRLLLKDWKEVPGDDIWLSKVMEAQARELKAKEVSNAKR
jgi:conjugal transfer pilus assembly protein TraE